MRVFGVVAEMAVGPRAKTAAPQAAYLSQDFNSSTSVADYVSATPSVSQLDAISSSGAGTVVSINASELQFARTDNAGSLTRMEGLTVSESFVLVVSARRYTFASPVQFVNLQNNLSGLNFTASP